MKIAAFHNLPAGGAKRFFYEALKYLSKKYDIDLYILSTSNEEFLNTKGFCKKIYKYDFKLDSNIKGFLGRLHKDYNNFIVLDSVHKNIAKDIDKRGYDVVLAWADRFSESPYILRYLETPSVYSVMELLRIAYEKILQFQENVGLHKRVYEELTRSIRKQIDLTNARSATIILSPSKFTVKQIKDAYDMDAELVYGGVDTKVFKKSKKSLSRLLFMGNKTDQDDYPLARNIEKMLSKKLKLVHLDFPKDKAKINNDKLVAKQYSRAYVTLCLDYAEPFGLKSLESMACETPVLAVNEGGYRESVIDGVTGYLLPRDPKAFSEKIKFLMDNPDIAKKMGKAGRAHVKKNFTWEKHGKCLEKHLYEASRLKKT